MNTAVRDRVAVATTSTTSAESYVIMGGVVAPAATVGDDLIENAIYSYIQARRSLGVTQINSAEIAQALQLPQRVVDAAVKNLTSKGVKLR